MKNFSLSAISPVAVSIFAFSFLLIGCSPDEDRVDDLSPDADNVILLEEELNGSAFLNFFSIPSAHAFSPWAPYQQVATQKVDVSEEEKARYIARTFRGAPRGERGETFYRVVENLGADIHATRDAIHDVNDSWQRLRDGRAEIANNCGSVAVHHHHNPKVSELLADEEQQAASANEMRSDMIESTENKLRSIENAIEAEGIEIEIVLEDHSGTYRG